MAAIAGYPPLTIDDVRAAIAEALAEPAARIADDADLLHLGLDSIGVMRLAAQWSRRGAPVTFAELAEWRTLAEWWALLSTRLAAGTPGGAQPEPGSGGGEHRPQSTERALVDKDDTAPFDLATMQHAYWVGRADGQPLGGVGAHFYNEFDGTGVAPDRLDAAVRALLRRHGMLRATFGEDGRQRIGPDSPWPGLVVHDLRGLPADEVERRLAELRDTLSHKRLAVERAEVFDVRLSLLPGGRTRVHVHIEMLVADAHSFRVLLADLAALYAGRSLPDIGYSYPAYLAEAATTRAATRAADREYWQGRLAELPGPPQLPLAVDPARVGRHRVTRRYRVLGAEEWAVLARRARGYGLTLPAVFLTAFAEVLAAWSANRRFLLNLPLYDRQPLHPDVEHLVGDFTNLLLLDVDATGPESFARRAARVQRRLRADAGHAAYSGVDVLRDLARLRDGTPVGAPVVFTSALGLGELFDDEVRRCFGVPGATMSQTPQVWLDHQVTEREGGLHLTWESVDELFSAGVPGAMFAAYTTVVDWLADGDWDSPVPDLLPAAARRVRDKANATDRPYRRRCLHADFFARAAAEPERLALAWGEDGRLSYGEL
ncbi:MAG TPA: condensation domain-containing protein, partial [Rugosimonospora sp.]|nr:condensation domain-containing protein [Rugosimonospora sp.]